MMLSKSEWHVQGITGDCEAVTTVVGSESDCRMISKLMVSSGQWDNAWVYPPGSTSDEALPGSEMDGMVVKGQPYEVYTVPNLGGVEGTESHSIKWRGWEHEAFDE